MHAIFASSRRRGLLSTIEANGLDDGRTEQDILDSLYDHILTRIEEGVDVDASEVCGDRPEMRGAVEQLIETARAVALIGRGVRHPESPAGFTICAELGRGGMAAVYLARQHAVGNRMVALKMLPERLAGQSLRERFRREAAAIAMLRHKHIVPVHDIVRCDEAFAIVMEAIDGGSLHDVIHSARARGATAMVDAARASIAMNHEAMVGMDYGRMIARWGAQIADGLHAVHCAGLLHRDVKPSNVLIRSDGTALLSDFGLVRDAAQASLTVTGGFAGTASYSSPEQLRGERDIDVRSDVYSLGATLYHALTLQRPYAGESAVQVLMSMERGEAAGMRGCGWIERDLETIVRAAMCPDRAGRYATAADLAADLTRFIDNRPIHARRPTLVYRARKLAARNRAALVTGLVASVVVGLICVLIAVRVFYWPRWSRGALLEARATAISREFDGQVFNTEFWQTSYDPRVFGVWSLKSAELRGRLGDALAHYDSAVRYGDNSVQTLGERDAVRLLVELLDGGSAAPQRVQISASASAYAHWMLFSASEGEAIPDRIDERQVPWRGEIDRLSHIELRQIGLLAYLLGDAASALAAWEQLELRGEDDPFAEGMLGLALVIRDRPVPGYARLYRAAEHFPTVRVFSMYAADAALRCGDLVIAKELYAAAAELEPVDRVGMVRLEVMIQLESGDHAGAISTARHLLTTRGSDGSTVLALQLAKRLEAIRQPTELVVEFATYAAVGSLPGVQGLRHFVPRARTYWSGLTAEQQERLAVEAVMSWAELPIRFGWQCRFFDAARTARELKVEGMEAWDAATPALAGLADRVHEVGSAVDPGAVARRVKGAGPERQRIIGVWLMTGVGEKPVELKAP